MSESLEQEIRTLRSLFWSERDPEGRVFAPLADAYLRAGETKEALELLTDGRARHPGFASGHVVATKLYLEKGMHGEAELAARQALELDAENVIALASLAESLESSGRGEEAQRLREKLAELDPDAAPSVAAFPAPTASDPDPGLDLEFGAPAAAAVETMKFSFSPSDDPEPAAEGGRGGDLPVPGAELEAELRLDAPEPDAELAFEALTLDALGDGSGMVAEDVLSLGVLEPDPEPAAEDVLSLDALGPDPEPAAEDVLSLDALAPDPEPVAEDVLSLDALAPDPEPVVEEVMSLDALAPDPEPAAEDVLSLDALAPDPEPVQEEVMSLDALAPDPEPAEDDVVSLDALAPDPEQVEEEVMSLDALAPDPEPAEDDVVSLDALAPDPEPVEEEVMSLDALAPDPEPATDDVWSLDALAPDAPPPGVVDLSDLAPSTPGPSPTGGATAPVWTRTLADLYVKQGFTDKALDVLRHLLDANPAASDVAARIAELESPPTRSAVGAPRGGGDEEEVETLARDLAESGHGEHEVDTPFTWTESEREVRGAASADGPEVGEYFDGLLSWQPRTGA